jgi:hypothetical protein
MRGMEYWNKEMLEYWAALIFPSFHDFNSKWFIL